MAWIESHQGLAVHPKTGKLARALKVTRVTAIGHLHLLWYFALDFAPDGNLTPIDPEEIAEGARWDGDANDFLDALIVSEFIDRDGDSITLHEWTSYGGKTITRMEKERDKKKNQRGKGGSGPISVPMDIPWDILIDNVGNSKVRPGTFQVTSHGCPEANNYNYNYGSSRSSSPNAHARRGEGDAAVEIVDNPNNPQPILFTGALLRNAGQRMKAMPADDQDAFGKCVLECFQIWGRAPNKEDTVKCFALLEWLQEDKMKMFIRLRDAGGVGELEDYRDPFCMTEKEAVLLAHAFQIAADADKKNITYLRGIINNWTRLSKHQLDEIWQAQRNPECAA